MVVLLWLVLDLVVLGGEREKGWTAWDGRHQLFETMFSFTETRTLQHEQPEHAPPLWEQDWQLLRGRKLGFILMVGLGGWFAGKLEESDEL
ncbi:hypothetical protein IWZ03DRAFT_381770 [Phyllosticta citriasiana]|uniref:Uncharacterized protein n=1 Tax=Phyllosticta citriasiana TaxID=595635 RepID=A0ABR1KJF0_9PEZI